MADITIKTAWNQYVDAFETEPSDAQHLFQEALNYAFKTGGEDSARQITFDCVKMIFNLNKGNGKIPVISHMAKIPTEEEIESLLDEIHDDEKTKHNTDGRRYLFYASSMKQLAVEMKNKSANTIELGTIDWETSDEGFPDLVINNTDNIRSADVIFLADFSHPKNVFEQYAIMCALPRYLAKSIKIFIGYFPTGKVKKNDVKQGSVATTNTLIRLLSSIPNTMDGPAQIYIYDMHTLQNPLHFTENVSIRLESCAVLIQKELKKMSNCCVAFPDEAVYQRYHDVFTDYAHILCTKNVIKKGEAKDKHVVIVDDFVHSGDTLVNCAKLMKDNKCKSVSCFVVHAVFPNESWRRFCKKGKDEGLLGIFYVTNTIPNVTDVLTQHAPFKVLSVSSVYMSCV